MSEEKQDRLKVKPMHDLIAEVGAAVGVPRAKVGEILKAFRDAKVRALGDGFIVREYDLGNMRLRDKSARKARNPRTGEVFDAPPGFRVKFEAGSALKALTAHKADGTKPYPPALYGAPKPTEGEDKPKRRRRASKAKPAVAPTAGEGTPTPPATPVVTGDDKELADLLAES